MNLLYLCRIREGLDLSAFGPAFLEHMRAKRHPGVQAASRSAWNLLARAVHMQGMDDLPMVRFDERGKPSFTGAALHFSLAHSKGLAAALISDMPCGVDIEYVRPDMAARMQERILSPREQAAGMDIFTAWTRKECIGKYSGQGLSARPAHIDTLDPACARLHFYTETVFDAAGREYRLSAATEAPLCLPMQIIEL